MLLLLKNTTKCYLRDFDAVDEIKPYVVVNLNKNAEQFFDELVQDIRDCSQKGYRIYYVPIAKGNNIYYQDLQYAQRLEKAL